MAKLIVAIDVDHNDALKIEAQAKVRHRVEIELLDGHAPEGYFNPDGRIAIKFDCLEGDPWDDDFVTFEYRGIEYGD